MMPLRQQPGNQGEGHLGADDPHYTTSESTGNMPGLSRLISEEKARQAHIEGLEQARDQANERLERAGQAFDTAYNRLVRTREEAGEMVKRLTNEAELRYDQAFRAIYSSNPLPSNAALESRLQQALDERAESIDQAKTEAAKSIGEATQAFNATFEELKQAQREYQEANKMLQKALSEQADIGAASENTSCNLTRAQAADREAEQRRQGEEGA